MGKELFVGINIGKVELNNRIVMPPMITSLADCNWGVTNRLIDYYVERAKGGVGLIIIESNAITPDGCGPYPHLGIFHDSFISGLNSIVDAVKPYGTKIGVQLGHVGRQTKWTHNGGRPVSASSVPCKYIANNKGALTPRELDKSEIEILIEQYGNAAERAKKAGFDLVEIHAAHGYLLSQFISPYTNFRNDEFGGDFHRRMSFPLKVIRIVKETLGDQVALSVRMNGSDYVPGGISPEESIKIAKEIEKAGADVLHVSGAIFESILFNEPKMNVAPPMCVQPGCNVHWAKRIRKRVHIPVITVGRINDPDYANAIIKNEDADLVSVGRGLIADPTFPLKAKEGRKSEIRKCLACNYCLGRIHGGLGIRCAVNARAGREADFSFRKIENAKRVAVIGGGPSGMETARVLSYRGHRVTLYEREKMLGGQLNLASRGQNKKEINNFVDYLIHQMSVAQVNVKVGVEVDEALLKNSKFDVVVLATGSNPIMPHWFKKNNTHISTALHILRRGVDETVNAQHIAIIGGGLIGCETAEFIKDNSKNHVDITILEQLEEVAYDVGNIEKHYLLQRLKEKNIKFLLGCRVTNIKEKKVEYQTIIGENEILKPEMIVVAVGSKSENGLEQKINNSEIDYYKIGDCKIPGKIYSAVHDAAFIARVI